MALNYNLPSWRCVYVKPRVKKSTTPHHCVAWQLDLFGASSMVATKDKAWDFYEWNNVKGTLRVQNTR